MLLRVVTAPQSHYSHISPTAFLSHCCLYRSSVCACVRVLLRVCMYGHAPARLFVTVWLIAANNTHIHTLTHTRRHTERSILGHCIVLAAADGSRGLSLKILAFLILSPWLESQRGKRKRQTQLQACAFVYKPAIINAPANCRECFGAAAHRPLLRSRFFFFFFYSFILVCAADILPYCQRGS